MKKTVVMLVVLFVVFSGSVIANTFDVTTVDFDVVLNKKVLSFDLPVITVNNWTYLPLREFCEKANMDITWDEENKKIFMNTNNDDSSLPDENDNDYSQLTVDSDLTLEDFEFMRLNMDMNEIYEVLGEPHGVSGFGRQFDVYFLENGDTVHLAYDYEPNFVLIGARYETKDGLALRIILEEHTIGISQMEHPSLVSLND